MPKAAFTVSVFILTLVWSTATAEVYRVGPGEEHSKISEVAQTLKAGDIVAVTGDITDHFTLSAHGAYGNPITVRGVILPVGVEDGSG